MCGIVGIAGKLEYRDEAAMKRLLLFDVFRGPDSTGFAGIRHSGEAKVAKLPSHPFDLFDSTAFKTALAFNTCRAFIGHNRFATVGKTNHLNAHPFEYGAVTGVHNGTLESTSFRALEEALDEVFTVDSQAIFAAIDRLGIEATVKMLQGAWSLVWFDNRDNTLNFLRNDQRPMWYAFTSDMNKLVYGSEHEIIQAALKMTSVQSDKYEYYKDEGGFSFFPTTEDVLYSINVKDLAENKDTVYKPKVKPCVGMPHKPLYVASKGGVADSDPFGRNTLEAGFHTPGMGKSTSGNKNGGKKNTDVGPKVLTLIGHEGSPYAGAVTRERFENMARTGCAWCEQPVEYGDRGITIIDRDDSILCNREGCSPSRHTRVVSKTPIAK